LTSGHKFNNAIPVAYSITSVSISLYVLYLYSPYLSFDILSLFPKPDLFGYFFTVLSKILYKVSKPSSNVDGRGSLFAHIGFLIIWVSPFFFHP
jgi:hypothetical protein